MRVKIRENPYPIVDIYPIDSDTVKAWVQISRTNRELWRVRLKGIEGGELDSVEGIKGRDILASIVRDKHHLKAHFHGNENTLDKYGRHVGDIAFEDGSRLCDALIAYGHHWRRERSGKEHRKPKEKIHG
jgi:endonuclease YncB( thermonuclease family)